MPLALEVWEEVTERYIQHIFPLLVGIRIFLLVTCISLIVFLLFALLAIVVCCVLYAIITLAFFLYLVLIRIIGTFLQVSTKSVRIQRFNFFVGSLFEGPVFVLSNFIRKFKGFMWKTIIKKHLKLSVVSLIVTFIFSAVLIVLSFTEYRELTVDIENRFMQVEAFIFGLELDETHQYPLILDVPHEFIDLRRGDRGDIVREIQLRLQELGFYTGSIDGDFGPVTEVSVILFQEAMGLEANGIFDVDAWMLLFTTDNYHKRQVE